MRIRRSRRFLFQGLENVPVHAGGPRVSVGHLPVVLVEQLDQLGQLRDEIRD